jgi:hypothetical protein
MSDLDYEELAQTAKELVDEAGRSVTIIRFNQTPADSGKPWHGPTSPRGTPDATATVIGCFVPLSTGSSLGLDSLDIDLMKRTTEVCLVAPGTTSPPFDLTTANEIVDGGINKKVSFVRRLKPADTTLLYFIGIER